MGTFGEKLRQQREQRGIALDAISNTTKISVRMLRALEEEHFDQLPGGVFNKGFVRAYARQVGLDDEEAVTDYLTALRESQIQQQSILPDFRGKPGGPASLNARPEIGRPIHEKETRIEESDDSDRQLHAEQHGKQSRKQEDRHTDIRTRPATAVSELDWESVVPPRRAAEKYPAGTPSKHADDSAARIPWGTLAASLLVVTLLLAAWNLRRHIAANTTPMPVASTPQPSPPSSLSTPPSQTPAVSANSLTVGKASAGTLTTGTKASGTLSPGTISAGGASAPTLPIAPPPKPQPTTSSSVPATPGATKPANSKSATTLDPPAAKVSAVKPPPTFTLLIRAEKTTWVSIVADAKPVAEETLIAPAHTSIRASHEIVVRTGNAGGISFQLNGKEISAEGHDGEVKTYIFSPSGVRVTQ